VDSDDFLQPADRLQQRATDRAKIPDRISFAVRAVQTRGARQTFEMRHRQLLVVRTRQVRIAGIARTDHVCHGPGAITLPGVQTTLGVDRRRDPPRPAITIQFAPPTRRPVGSPVRHGPRSPPVPLSRPRKEEGSRTPARSYEIGTRPPSRWGSARRSTAPAPQSKPVAHAPRLVAQIAPLVAFGLGMRILAAGPAHQRLYSHRRRLCDQHSKEICSARAPARASADSSLVDASGSDAAQAASARV
jgi:hypothetical protein